MKKYKWVDTIWINSITQKEEWHRLCLNEDEPHSRVYINKCYGQMFKWDNLKLYRVIRVVPKIEALDEYDQDEYYDEEWSLQ